MVSIAIGEVVVPSRNIVVVLTFALYNIVGVIVYVAAVIIVSLLFDLQLMVCYCVLRTICAIFTIVFASIVSIVIVSIIIIYYVVVIGLIP